MKYFDFHIHSVQNNSVFNLIIGKDSIPEQGIFTAGIHPWFIEDPEKQFSELKKISEHARCIAIGECGLDRLKGPVLADQIKTFQRQLELAVNLNKNVIVHCVKAHNELLEIKADFRSDIKWIIHGYNQNETIAKRLYEKGFYFSFGKPMIHPTSNCSKVMKMISDDRFFLETDSADITIEEVYKAASERLGLTGEELSVKLQQNFEKVFGIYE